MVRQNPIYLDKVERKFLNKLKELSPEYDDLEIDQIAHLKLKDALYECIRERLKNNGPTSSTMPLWFNLVRKITLVLYRFENKIKS